MTAQRIKKLTVEEYVELERSTNTKYEYHNGEVFAMAGASINHNRLCGNIYVELRYQLKLKKSRCETFNSDTKINLQAYNNKYLYPDAMVVCGNIKQPENFKDAITNPTLIVEVLSESTADYDRGEKFYKYGSIKTFQEYVLVAQDKPVVEIFYRKPGTETWEINRYEGLETTFNLQSLKIEIEMKALYERIVFEDDLPKSKKK